MMGRKNTDIWDVIIIGAGASGMMAAITSARRGKSVLLLEQMSRPGKKLLATGNGKCNFTNEYMDVSCYHGNQELIRQVLSRFSEKDTLAFFREIGIFPKNKKGYYYPNSEQALSVVCALEMELARAGALLITESALYSLQTDRYGFICQTKTKAYRSRNVIFATGLLAAPKLGSNGSAFSAIKAMGHRFTPILPALCGFYCTGMDFHQVSGVRCDSLLTLEIDGQIVGKEYGQLQLTDYGLSGIPVFQLSAPAAHALYEKKSVCIHICFLPDMDKNELRHELHLRMQHWQDGAGVLQMLGGLLNQKLVAACLTATGIAPQKKAGRLSELEISKIADWFMDCAVTLIRVREAEYAQVCTGGIRTEEIHIETLESRIQPHLFFAGELLDADGICGGYNLQWAWSSGYVAGSQID